MVLRRNECGSNAMVTVQMTVEEYLEMKWRQDVKSCLHSSCHARPDLASLTRPNNMIEAPVIKGPVPHMIKSALDYLRTNVIKERIIKPKDKEE